MKTRNMESISNEKSSIKQVIDQRISRYEWMVILLCFAIALFDGFDTQAVAFTAPALLEHFKEQLQVVSGEVIDPYSGARPKLICKLKG